MRTYYAYVLACTVAERVLARLSELERNQAWLARKIGVDISTVYRWLIEERPIPTKRLPTIAQILGLSLEELTHQRPEVAA